MSALPFEHESRRARILVLVAIVLLALNLRVAVGSLGVLLSTVRDDIGMSSTIAGILTTLPVLCFAFFGATTNSVVRKVGLHRTAALLLVLIVIGLVVRSVVDSQALFVVASAAALAGGAVGNVVLPPLVKLHFPHKIATVSSLYTAAMMGGAALASALSVPIADVGGGWRVGLFAWAVLALITLLPWLGLLRHDVHVNARQSSKMTLATVRSSPLAWAMALFFATQSAQAYAQFGWLPAIFVDAGLSSSAAALLQSIVPGIGIPLTLMLPYLMRKFGHRPVLPWFFGLVTIAGWTGILLAPTNAPWLWAGLLGLGGGAFSWVLTMLAQRTRTPDGTAALSSFVQGVGYLLAAIGPFGAGFLNDLTGSWAVPLLCLTALALLVIPLGTYISRPRMFEDTLRRPPPARSR